MAFNARLYIQGVVNYVPHTDGNALLGLMPDQQYAASRGIVDFAGEEICRHYCVVQCAGDDIAASLPPNWLTVDASRHWIGVATDSSPLELPDGGGIEGVVSMKDVLDEVGLSEYGGLNTAVLPSNGGTDTEPLKAGLYLNQGAVSADEAWTGRFTFYRDTENATDLTADYTNVVKVDFGAVDNFRLRLKPFDGGAPVHLDFAPQYDELDVWIRHFCELDKPDPDGYRPEPDDPDADFALAYALRDNLTGLLNASARLPYPRVWGSWAEGNPIGGRPNRCMPVGERAAAFIDPTG